jgi:hypothetical protein
MRLLGPLIIQILYLTPLFWLMELVHNQFFRVVLNGGEWGWHYPRSRHGWFSFWSLPAWAATVAIFCLLHCFLFERWRAGLPARVAVGGAVGWLGEYSTGFFAARVLKKPLQIWNRSRLRFVRPIALPFWMTNLLLYYFLVHHLGGALPLMAAR